MHLAVTQRPTTTHLVLPLITAKEFIVPLSASMLNLGPPRLFHSHLLADAGSARHEFICDDDTVSTRRGALGNERKRRCAHNVQTRERTREPQCERGALAELISWTRPSLTQTVVASPVLESPATRTLRSHVPLSQSRSMSIPTPFVFFMQR